MDQTNEKFALLLLASKLWDELPPNYEAALTAIRESSPVYERIYQNMITPHFFRDLFSSGEPLTKNSIA